MEEHEANHCPLCGECELIQNHKDRMPELIFRLMERYCRDDYSKCARKWLVDTLGRSAVPELMMPSQWEWAHNILDDHDCGFSEPVDHAAKSSAESNDGIC